jgi:hypothetical protein
MVWTISSSADAASWTRCDGEFQIDPPSGYARGVGLDGDRVRIGWTLHVGLGQCSLSLNLVQRYRLGGRLVLPSAITGEDVACWLARFFGPQALAGSPATPTTLELPFGVGPIFLLSDVVVLQQSTLEIIGNGNTIVVGTRQVRVFENATLTLESIIVAESVESSAVVVIGGSLILRNSTIRDCRTSINFLNPDGMLEARGGAVTLLRLLPPAFHQGSES